ncbi:hypothetical protein Hte_010951 [Hypoxylon texense]
MLSTNVIIMSRHRPVSRQRWPYQPEVPNHEGPCQGQGQGHGPTKPAKAKAKKVLTAEERRQKRHYKNMTDRYYEKSPSPATARSLNASFLKNASALSQTARSNNPNNHAIWAWRLPNHPILDWGGGGLLPFLRGQHRFAFMSKKTKKGTGTSKKIGTAPPRPGMPPVACGGAGGGSRCQLSRRGPYPTPVDASKKRRPLRDADEVPSSARCSQLRR